MKKEPNLEGNSAVAPVEVIEILDSENGNFFDINFVLRNTSLTKLGIHTKNLLILTLVFFSYWYVI